MINENDYIPQIIEVLGFYKAAGKRNSKGFEVAGRLVESVDDLEKQKRIAYEMIATGIRRGVPILQTFESASRAMYDKRLRRIFASIEESILQGSNISIIVSKHKKLFSEIEIKAIQEAEEDGTIDKAFFKLAK